MMATPDKNQTSISQYCGYVAIVGRPNVGKSTLLNYLIGQKLSITSRRPQTTRHQILGIKTDANKQVIYVDTPGLHQDQNANAINRYMNKAATSALYGIDAVIFVVDRDHWYNADEYVYQVVSKVKVPVIVAINKIDAMPDKHDLLPYLQQLQAKLPEASLIPISAKHGQHLDNIEKTVLQHLPVASHIYDAEQITDRSSRFVAAELVREKIMRQLGDELPYQMTVEIEDFAHVDNLLHISALILVERQGQKRILIGNKGDRIKLIGKEARMDMQTMFDCQVMLNLWVKVKTGWFNDQRALQSLGYDGLE